MYIALTGVVVNSAEQDALPYQQRIDIVQGSDLLIDGYTFGSNAAPIDITDSTINITIKKHSWDDGYGEINKDATIVDGPNGRWTIALSNTETLIASGSYVFQVSYVDEDGLRDYIVPSSAWNVSAALDEDQ